MKNVLNFMGLCYSLMWAAGYCATVTSGSTGFEYCLVVHAYRTASGCDFLAVNWVVGII